MFRKGEQLAQYKLVKKLGSGAFGEVWLADSEDKLGISQVAIKFPREVKDLEQLKREIDVWINACNPPHPNVLTIFETDVIEDQPLIVSEYAAGGSLDDWLKNNNDIPSIEKAIELTTEILKGLDHLHSKAIVHRDIKPQNILFVLQENNQQHPILKLADFGFAKVLGDSHTTGIFGTAAYIAPETLSDEDEIQARRYSPQSDLWAVGIIFYQLISGKTPFPQPVPAVFMAILKKDYLPLPDNIPSAIKTFVRKSLDKDPDKRYQSATEMIKALQACRFNWNNNNQIGPYRLIRELDKGKFASAFLAEKNSSATKVAIKILFGQQNYESITKQARIWEQLNGYPNILPIMDVGVYDELLVIVTKYAQDGSLQDWLQRQEGKVTSLMTVFTIIDGILTGLEYLHSKRVTHCNLNPSNILLDGQIPKISDFGIYPTISNNEIRPTDKRLAYLSPEILHQNQSSELGDLWAASVILYQMLTGRLPWLDIDTNKLITMIVSEQLPPLPSNIPISIKFFIAKCLDKDPSVRYQSATEMKAALKSCLANKLEIFKPGQLMQDDPDWGNKVGSFVYIPAGKFLMGSNLENSQDDELKHKVIISNSFEMGRYQVTQYQWQAVMGNNPSRFKGNNLPVENVSWKDAQDFIKKINQKSTKYFYNLPTEEQWEYAAKAGTKNDYEPNLNELAWHHRNSLGRTHPVGQKLPNLWGLYDMYGNVSEWCLDLYQDYINKSKEDEDPQFMDFVDLDSERVNRGGSWKFSTYYCRPACREYEYPDFCSDYLGFRLVRNLRYTQ